MWPKEKLPNNLYSCRFCLFFGLIKPEQKLSQTGHYQGKKNRKFIHVIPDCIPYKIAPAYFICQLAYDADRLFNF